MWGTLALFLKETDAPLNMGASSPFLKETVAPLKVADYKNVKISFKTIYSILHNHRVIQIFNVNGNSVEEELEPR